jgi:predicted aldo/keto reductase-like oxidoreductase
VSNPGLIRAAYHAGIRVFFSATYYGEGSNERMVGEGLKDFSRDSYLVGTAIPLAGYDTKKGVLASPLKVDEYVKKADESLARFGLDHVDFLLFPYAGKRSMILDETLIRALKKVKKSGKTRFLGIASHSFSDEALLAAAEAGVYDIAMVAYNFRTENKKAIDEAISKATQAGMGIIAMKTTAGAFTDKTATKKINTDAALKWVLQNQQVSSIVSGMSSLEELEKNLEILKDLKMSDKEKQDLRATSAGEAGLYCLQCRRCVPQCRHSLEIPDAMRSYMYAYGYHDFRFAKHTFLSGGIPADPCGDCDHCYIKCTAGFNIKERLQDISRICNVPEEFLG